jgi:hypothetical protein
MDDSSTGAEMKGDDLTFYLDYMAGHLHEKNGADNGKMLEAIKRWQPSAEVLDDDDSDEALNRYFSDYRHFLETDLATNLHYYWDWYDDFTLKERNLIDPILGNPMAKELIDKIWEEYQNPKPKPAEPFTLPEDFFDWQHKSDTPKEYFYMDDAFKKKGVDTIVAFIDWLADKGYIEDDNGIIHSHHQQQDRFPQDGDQFFSFFSRENSEKTVPVPQAETVPLGRLPYR